MTLWSNKTIKTTHVSIISLVISKLRRCWGPRPPQKFRKSHWCVPFTATFSKRRKIGALWSERCDVLDCQNISWLFLTKFSQMTFLPRWFCEAPPPGHRTLSQPTPFTSGASEYSSACWAPVYGRSSVYLQQNVPAYRGFAYAQNAKRAKVSKVLDSFCFLEEKST